MFSARIKPIFLFNFKDFFTTILGLMIAGVALYCKSTGLSLWNVFWCLPVIALLMKFFDIFLNCFFYIEKKEIRWEQAKFDNNGNIIPESIDLIEYYKSDGSVIRFNKDGSFHTGYYPTFEKDNKKYFRYKKQYIQCDNAKMVANVAKIDSF